MSDAPANKLARKRCHLAWHITARCNLACKHCLRHTPTQPTTDLPVEDCRRILDSFLQFARETDRDAELEFSGGNPLLRKDFPEHLAKAGAEKKAGLVKNIRILGNPETIDDEMVRRLADAGVDDFVVSLDGLEEINDRMRGPGSFRAGMRALRALVAAGVPTSVKFTLVRDNAHQALDLFRLVIDEGAKHFGVGPLILCGGGWKERDRALSNLEYRQVLLEFLQFFDNAGNKYAGARRAFLAHNRLYALLFHELGRLDEYRALTGVNPGPFGMPRDRSSNVLFVVWSDGEVVLRREMARQGRVPQQTFREIYDNSPMLHLIEDSAKIHELAREHQRDSIKCSACPINNFCLPGVAGTFGQQLLFARNGHCWR